MAMAGGKRVSYYYDPDIGNFYYGQVTPFYHAPPQRSAGSSEAGWRVEGRERRRRGFVCLRAAAAAAAAPLAAPLACCARSA